MVQMALCDLLHTFHKQVTNVSQQVFDILLWGILTSPLKAIAPFVYAHPRCAARAYEREYGWFFNTGAYGAMGVGVIFKRLYLC